MQIVDVDLSFDRCAAVFVCCSITEAGFHPCSGHEHRETFRVVAATVARAVVRRAPELAAPYDQRVLQQTALLQICNEPRNRLVDRRTTSWEPCRQSTVMIPTVVGHLNEANPGFGKSPCEQTLMTEVLRSAAVDSIKGLRGLSLLREIDNIGERSLHAKTKFERLDHAFEFGRLLPLGQQFSIQ